VPKVISVAYPVGPAVHDHDPVPVAGAVATRLDAAVLPAQTVCPPPDVIAAVDGVLLTASVTLVVKAVVQPEAVLVIPVMTRACPLSVVYVRAGVVKVPVVPVTVTVAGVCATPSLV